MKKLATIFFIIISITCFSQPARLDSVSLRGNILRNYSGGVVTIRGGVDLPQGSGTPAIRWDSAYNSYYSIKAGLGGAHPGNKNVCIGDGVMDSVVSGASFNILIGHKVMSTGKTGNNNVGLGWEALRENKGSDNVGISEDALRDNTTGHGNVAIGRGAMNYNLNGHSNMAVGYNSLQLGLHNNENVCMGDYTGAWLVTGDGNVFIGSYAGESNGSDNVVQNDGIAIGRYAGIGGAIGSRSICIGYNTQTNGNDQLNIGNTITGVNLGLTTAAIAVAGDLASKSISVSNGYKITADDIGLNIVTPTAGTKRISYDALLQAARYTPFTETTQPEVREIKQAFMIYSETGQLLGKKILILKPIK